MNTLRRFRAPLAWTFGALVLVILAGCGPVRLIANTNIPAPLVVKMPIAIALFIPKEFSGYVHHEERWSTDWHVDLGKAQSEGITRLMNAMFERVVQVESVSAGQAHASGGIRAILEPSIEEFAFVTPRDAGSPFFAVSIKYRVNIFLPDGKLADSWGFTGYGTAPAEGLSSAPPLQTATALAMRDAGAKLAVEFREQATMRGLLPGGASADTFAKPAENSSDPAAPANQAVPGAPGAPANTAPPAPTNTAPPNTAPTNTPQPAPAEPATSEPEQGDSDDSQNTDDSPGESPPPEPPGTASIS